jgi:hypothetical protein
LIYAFPDALHRLAISWTKLVYSLVFPYCLLHILFLFPFLQSYINRHNCNYSDVDLWASWLFNFQITVLTAVVPTLVNVTNSIFLTNKYQQEYVAHEIKPAHYSV